jgi:hypothetical protein
LKCLLKRSPPPPHFRNIPEGHPLKQASTKTTRISSLDFNQYTVRRQQPRKLRDQTKIITFSYHNLTLNL